MARLYLASKKLQAACICTSNAGGDLQRKKPFTMTRPVLITGQFV